MVSKMALANADFAIVSTNLFLQQANTARVNALIQTQQNLENTPIFSAPKPAQK